MIVRAIERGVSEDNLGGNQEYQDLGVFEIEDLVFALAYERALLSQVSASPDPATAEAQIYAARSPGNDPSDLSYLDLGVAAATAALNVAGAHTFLSCNGGVFGTRHGCDVPQIRFYLQDLDAGRLLDWARRTGVRIIQQDDFLALVGEVDAMMAFAEVVHDSLQERGNCR